MGKCGTAKAEMIGHGMNEGELALNPSLNRRFVQNLDLDPVLTLADASVDGGVCCVWRFFSAETGMPRCLHAVRYLREFYYLYDTGQF